MILTGFCLLLLLFRLTETLAVVLNIRHQRRGIPADFTDCYDSLESYRAGLKNYHRGLIIREITYILTTWPGIFFLYFGVYGWWADYTLTFTDEPALQGFIFLLGILSPILIILPVLIPITKKYGSTNFKEDPLRFSKPFVVFTSLLLFSFFSDELKTGYFFGSIVFIALFLFGFSKVGRKYSSDSKAGVKKAGPMERILKVGKVKDKIIRLFAKHNFTFENAFTTPHGSCQKGGKIYINEDLVKDTEREKELLPVVAHELAHSALHRPFLMPWRDWLFGLFYFCCLSFMWDEAQISAVLGSTHNLFFLNGLGAIFVLTIFTKTANLLKLLRLRKMEYEAEIYAAYLLENGKADILERYKLTLKRYPGFSPSAHPLFTFLFKKHPTSEDVWRVLKNTNRKEMKVLHQRANYFLGRIRNKKQAQIKKRSENFRERFANSLREKNVEEIKKTKKK